MKKLKPYIITLCICIAIFLIVFISKGIFPFGNHSLIWGDMHDQITAFYYHLYDSIRGDGSLLINFSTSSGINFIGILAYYILSPISLLILFFPRDQIYLVVSLIVALKIILSSITCLYFIRTYFKKIPYFLSIMLAISYAFSGYSLTMYQITSWIDLMYLFPILMIGLKKVLDLEKPILYILILTISLICSFYVSMMVIIFIFLGSFLYLLVYKEKQERKKAILSLGISTIISLLLSAFIVVPSYLQISISSRMNFSLSELLNSKTGPITDKLAMFMFGGIIYVGIIILLRNFKNHKKFISFYIPTLLIMLIPIIIEPINKIWHFGSYVFFPYRAGFIAMFLLVLGASYGFEHYAYKKRKESKKIMDKIMIIITSLVAISGIIFLTSYYYQDFQSALDTLTLSINHLLLWMLLFTTFLAFLGCFIILIIYKKLNFLSLLLIGLITITHITCNSFLYLGIDFTQDSLMSQYEDLQKLEKTYQKGDYYRVKNITSNYIMNNGMVMRYHNLDHFTSLTDRSNLSSLKKLGYSSMWVKTYSKGGTLFTDSLLANRYIMSREKITNPYYHFVGKYGNIYFYEANTTPSYGYFLNDNVNIMDKNNSFEIQNSIYNSITGAESLFTIIDDYHLMNIEKTKNQGMEHYHIIDEDAYNYIEKEIEVHGRGKIYLEILKDLNNTINSSIYQKFNIYINDQLFRQSALTETDNGVIDLGTYEDKTVNIKIELKDDVELDNITLGILDLDKYDEFIEKSLNSKIDYHKNKVKVTVTSDKKQLLFLPIAYNEGYEAKLNGNKTEVIKVLDNYIGIMVEEGENNITLSFIPKGFLPTLIISMITLVMSIIIFKTNIYDRLLNITWLQNIAYYLYLVLYFLVIFLVYIMMILIFILSYFVWI